MKTLLLFDIDGTLLDAAGAGKTGFYQALAERFPARAFPDISMAGRTDYGLWHELVDDPAQAAPAGFAAFLEAYAPILEERLALHPPREVPGGSALLREIARHPDLVPCLVTGNILEGARHKLAALGWWEVFAQAGGWGAYGEAVPTKRTLATALLERWQAAHPEPFRAVFLGDTLADLECAQHAGIPCLVVNGNRPDAEFLERGASACWKDYRDDPHVLVERLRTLAAAPT